MRPPPRLTCIDQKKVLLVDGNDELNFYAALLQHLGGPQSEFQVYQFAGTDEEVKSRVCGDVLILSAGGSVTQALPNLKATYSGFTNVSVLGIITDAEKNAENRLRSVRDSLIRGDLPKIDAPLAWVPGPPKTGLLIQPPGKPSGMIEDMCLESITGQPITTCIEEFLTCATTRGQVQGIVQPSKARVRSFLATRKDPDKSVGAAASAGYWDLDAPVWNPVKTFLHELCNG